MAKGRCHKTRLVRDSERCLAVIRLSLERIERTLREEEHRLDEPEALWNSRKSTLETIKVLGGLVTTLRALEKDNGEAAVGGSTDSGLSSGDLKLLRHFLARQAARPG